MDLKPFTPDCGHTVTPTPGSIGTGKATDPDTGRTSCYSCAEAEEREAFRTADRYCLYVAEDAKRLTTWTGAELARITSITRGVKRFGKNGPYRTRFITATAPDGSRWYGRGSDDADAITVHRHKD